MTRNGWLLALVLAALPLVVRAQEPVAFECSTLLDRLGFASERHVAGTLPLYPQGEGSRPSGSDPISLAETLGQGAALVGRSAPILLDAGVGASGILGCGFTMARFDTSEGAPMQVGEADGREGEVLPILVPRLFTSMGAENAAFNAWATDEFDLPLLLGVSDLGTTASDPTLITRSSFQPLGYYSNRRPDGLRVYEFPPGFWQNADFAELGRMIAREAPLARRLLVLCEPDGCDRITAALGGMAEDASDPVEAAPAPDPAPPPVEPPRPTHRPATVRAPEPTTPTPPPLEASIEFSFVGRAGAGTEPTDRGGAVFQELIASEDGRPSDILACLLTALGAELFQPPPRCDPQAMEGLGGRAARITIDEDGAWRVVEGLANVVPQSLSVELPPGLNGTLCVLRLRPQSGAPIEMRRIGGRPVQFRIDDLAGRISPTAGRVQFRLEPQDALACGGPPRSVDMPAGRELRMALVDGTGPRRGLLYTTLFNQNDLASAVGLSPNQANAMGAAVLGAVEGVHSEAAARFDDRPWPLVYAELAYLDRTSALRSSVELNAESLRTRVTAEFDRTRADAISTMVSETPGLSASRIAGALDREVSGIASDGVVNELTVVLIGAVNPRPLNRLDNPCLDPRYTGLAERLSREDGPRVSVIALPLVPLGEASDAAGLSLGSMVPLSPSTATPSEPAGGYRCLGLAADTEIYPFFLAPWQSASAIPTLYASFLAGRLSDRLGTVLKE